MEIRPKGPECALALRSEVGRSGPRSEEEHLSHQLKRVNEATQGPARCGHLCHFAISKWQSYMSACRCHEAHLKASHAYFATSLICSHPEWPRGFD
jgi:hypothetical protein